MSNAENNSPLLSEVLYSEFPSPIANVLFYDILYLADWHYAIRSGRSRTITGAEWKRGPLGPFCADLAEASTQYHGDCFYRDVWRVKILENVELRPTWKSSERGCPSFDKPLQEEELDSLNHVIRLVREADEGSETITKIVYGTMPMMEVDMYAVLNISKMAVRHAKIFGYHDTGWIVPELETIYKITGAERLLASTVNYAEGFRNNNRPQRLVMANDDEIDPAKAHETFNAVFENYKARTSRSDNYAYLEKRSIVETEENDK